MDQRSSRVSVRSALHRASDVYASLARPLHLSALQLLNALFVFALTFLSSFVTMADDSAKAVQIAQALLARIDDRVVPHNVFDVAKAEHWSNPRCHSNAFYGSAKLSGLRLAAVAIAYYDKENIKFGCVSGSRYRARAPFPVQQRVRGSNRARWLRLFFGLLESAAQTDTIIGRARFVTVGTMCVL